MGPAVGKAGSFHMVKTAPVRACSVVASLPSGSRIRGNQSGP